MRPVDKGTAPNVYAHYQDARVDLIDRLGNYCSYCERRVETHLAVEHILPQSQNYTLRNSWANFLLSCVHCNSSKGNKHVVLGNYYWPDRDNTLRAIEYVDGGLAQPHAGLTAGDQVRARDTIALTGLDKSPGNQDREPTASDRRWLRRQQTWQLAKELRACLATEDTAVVRELIVKNAIARGMFSIWWTVFAGDVDMRRRLREAFIGTHEESFDISENPVPRVGGLL
ncbi:MAG: HNH endonuclease [Truepera sp.]|nr:HNH endonuclease [Truepera sp.]